MSTEKTDYDKFKEWHREYDKKLSIGAQSYSLCLCKDAWDAACAMKDEKIEKFKNELKDARAAYDHLSSEYRNLDRSFDDYQKENEGLMGKIEKKDAEIAALKNCYNCKNSYEGEFCNLLNTVKCSNYDKWEFLK